MKLIVQTTIEMTLSKTAKTKIGDLLNRSTKMLCLDEKQ